MNILIVYAHQEPTSFTAAMKNVALDTLSRQGHTIVVSDLYAQGFNAVAQKWDFVTTSGKHFNYMLEQKHAANLDLAFSPDITSEIEKVHAADIILFLTPIWWFSVPAILKGWFDRVLAMGVTWDGGRIYENGMLRGKQAMVIAAGGGPPEYYKREGKHKATVNDILHPIHHGTLAFCGLNVHEPFVALNVLGSSQDILNHVLTELQYRLQNMVASPNWLIFYSNKNP
ncbi:NAD(P)H-dependent oxidoreductase [Candidatus Saccharibacteria bacterium]|jgi:NAD(P)H dehydrogenase (quinone)|nr:NAD(P)H-dependent oxidoreductase [Candidatus Saccharibacteria bacterium]